MNILKPVFTTFFVSTSPIGWSETLEGALVFIKENNNPGKAFLKAEETALTLVGFLEPIKTFILSLSNSFQKIYYRLEFFLC